MSHLDCLKCYFLLSVCLCACGGACAFLSFKCAALGPTSGRDGDSTATWTQVTLKLHKVT